MGGKWPYIVLIFAILLGGFATLLVSRYAGDRGNKTSVSGKSLFLKPVVVSVVDLTAGSKLSPESMRVAEWPEEAVPKTAVGEIKQLIGRVLIVPISAGEPILQSRLAAEGIEEGLTAIISPGKRAMSVKVDEIIGVAGFIAPASRVDILVTIEDNSGRIKMESTAKIILQNIKVLASGQKLTREEKKVDLVNVVTLEVTPEEATKLALAANKGKLQLALRNQIDQEETKSNGISALELIDSVRPSPAVAVIAKRSRYPVGRGCIVSLYNHRRICLGKTSLHRQEKG